MAYREFRPPAPLRELVECGWTNEFPARPVASSVDILPDGCMDLVWTGTELLVAGPDTAPHPYRPPAGRDAAGLRFAPGRLPTLLGVSAAALRDLRVPLLELLPRSARSATARLERGAPPAGVLVELAGQLPGPAPDPGVAVVVGHARRGRSVDATADALGWTTRSLHRHCRDWFGYGPSVLRRVLRFRDAVALLRTGIAPADVAARAGYADQPHLSREMRALAGRAPRQFTTGAS
ncbi:MAG TPA: AraC family transcriptional regulator [Pseudonocardia sp.]|nr:AraC family transcriptional regulator [Pseudonocardia sp.]